MKLTTYAPDRHLPDEPKSEHLRARWLLSRFDIMVAWFRLKFGMCSDNHYIISYYFVK
jgi:hypothetical protein